MKNTTLAIAAAVIAACGGAAWAYHGHARAAEIDAMKPPVNLATAYLTQVLQADTKPGSMTYGEFFSRSATAVQEIDKKEIELKILEIKYADDERSTALAYMVSAQDAIRSEAALYHAKSDAESALTEAQEASSELTSAAYSGNQFIYEDAKRRMSKALDLAKKDAKEMGDSETHLRSSLIAVRAASDKVIQTFASKDIPTADIDAAIKKHAATRANSASRTQ